MTFAPRFFQRFSSLIVAVLSCFDRVLFRGYPPIRSGEQLSCCVDRVLRILYLPGRSCRKLSLRVGAWRPAPARSSTLRMARRRAGRVAVRAGGVVGFRLQRHVDDETLSESVAKL